MFFKFFRRKATSEKQLEEEIDSKLEIDRQNLIRELENADILFLLQQMNNKNYYSDWINIKRNSVISSNDSIAWYAYRQSEKLKSAAHKSALLELLDKDEFPELKIYIYRCLASICSNTHERELFNFLVEKMSNEEDDSIKIATLSRLQNAKKDAGFNLAPIKKLLSEGTYDISHAAIKALSNSIDPEVEDLLLYEFKIVDNHMKSIICSTLRTIASEKSIPVLKEAYKATRDLYLKSSIDSVFEQIKERGNPAGNIGKAKK